MLTRLHQIVQQRALQNAQVQTKVDGMTKIAFDTAADKDKRESAMKNLLVLSREKAGSDLIIKGGVLQKIKSLMKLEKNSELCLTSIRIVGEICRHSVDKAKVVLKDIGLPWFLEILDSGSENQVTAAEYCMQTILNTFSGMDNKLDTKPDNELCEANKLQIDTLLSCLVYSLNNPAVSGLARDALIELLMKNIHYSALNWAERMVEIGGVERLLQCASEVRECQYESSLNITGQTSTIAAVCLQRVYENMYYDAAKAKFMQKIEDFMKEKLLNPEIESKVRFAATLTSLLRSALEVGNAILGKEGILEMILVMANSDDLLQQRVASECIIAAANKADKAKAIITQGAAILKRLYTSNDEGIKVRALVGLCKLASSGGSDASIKPFAEGSNLKLAEACRRFLLQPGKDNDMQKWAAEGLSYLTLDAEVSMYT